MAFTMSACIVSATSTREKSSTNYVMHNVTFDVTNLHIVQNEIAATQPVIYCVTSIGVRDILLGEKVSVYCSNAVLPDKNVSTKQLNKLRETLCLIYPIQYQFRC